MSDKWYISGPLAIGTPEPGAQLEVGGALIATKDGDELIGLKIHTNFDDNGKSNVKHYGLIVFGTVAMGESTTASGRAATAMGLSTTASEYAATAMGEGTTASGRAATAMGNNAKASHTSSFVWSDGSPCTSMNSQEFRIRAASGFWVEGTAHATGGWAAAGTDYAEYFESMRGQKIEVGMTVALAEGKIRVAQVEDTPIGVISANPVVLGGAYAEWPKKYVRDEFGQVLMESYQDEVMVQEVDDQGKPVVRGTAKFVTKQRPRINPAYDPAKKYIPRAERPEWNCVGLLGQLPVRKGQVVAPNWIKMRELSPNVDLWLVK